MNLRYKEILGNFQGKRILIIGDVMLDEYLIGEVERISPEAPVPVVELKDHVWRIGGAGNVANNVLSLGGIPFLLGIIGDDREGEIFYSLLVEKGLDTSGLIKTERPTITKTRVIAHSQQLVRIDKEIRDPVDKETEDEMVKRAERLMENVDAVLFEDYDKGTITPGIIERVKELAKKKGILITVDPKIRNFFNYTSVSLFKPNEKEIQLAFGRKAETEEEIMELGRQLRERIKSPVLLTRGKHGMVLFDNDGEYVIPSHAREVYDVTGAGDTVIATVTLAMVAGASLREASYLSSIAAGIEVGKFGAATVTPEEIEEELNGEGG
ncbi:D-glycero-beta-D-manno-heptose-7-phosphate kinase [bacterium]|nr:MAG: D-glycero-beta-D-manno-heptose-7-phosphate kinase [bacterium]